MAMHASTTVCGNKQGRTIAGLILENWACGRKNHVWVSVSADLKHDARRDLDDVGACYVDLHPLNKIPYTALRSKKCGVENGVVFLTYSTLISSTEKVILLTCSCFFLTLFFPNDIDYHFEA